MRIGSGYDIHKLVPERTLYLGGVKVDYPKGLQGHSDGDVLLHAVCDAMLGAAGLGDIGVFFPDSDPSHKGANSTTFVESIYRLIHDEHGWEVENLDCTVFARTPKLGSVRDDIRKNLAWLLHTGQQAINVKFKTMNEVGPVGRGDAIAAQALLLLDQQKK
jgi:2-C-methyl-D-erythritol 2,4-cyclodiphosphate synthase